MEFVKYTIIKGKDLKNTKLVKILNRTFVHKKFKYVENEYNVDILPFKPHGQCSDGGLYFCELKDMYLFFNYGCYVCEIELDDDEDVYVEDNKFKTHRLFLKEKQLWESHEIWQNEKFCENATQYDSKYEKYCVLQSIFLETSEEVLRIAIDICAYPHKIYIQNQIPAKFKEEFYLYIAIHRPHLIDKFAEKYKTIEMYENAIKNLGCCIKYVPKSLLTEYMCILACTSKNSKYVHEHIPSIFFEKHPEYSHCS